MIGAKKVKATGRTDYKMLKPIFSVRLSLVLVLIQNG
jgi:hypothetical protein